MVCSKMTIESVLPNRMLTLQTYDGLPFGFIVKQMLILNRN
jgi:hypothetical protein